MLSVGSTGDVQPLIALGKELQSQGHEISILAFEELRGMVEGAGFSFVTLPGSASKYITAMLTPDKNLLQVARRFRDCLLPVYPQMMQTIYDFCDSADVMLTTFFGRITYSLCNHWKKPLFQVYFFPLEPTGEFSAAITPMGPTRPHVPMPDEIGAPFISILKRQVAIGPVTAAASVGAIQTRGFLTMLPI